MKTGKFKNDISKRENMEYDGIRDEYTCANHKKLRAAGTEKRVSKGGYESEVTIYESEGCELFLVCLGYNMNKLHHKIQQGRCGTSLHPLKQKAS
ncbi:MAG: hypothetical protein LBF95_10765 [Treponema sp.]|jgi:hypothetical protein|nr:hypothetical protein [Treponema sp.]